MANSYDNIKKYATTFIGFDEASGDVYDSIGSFTATVYNNPQRVTGWNGEGYAMQFNGTSQYVQFTSQVLKVGNKTIRLKVKTIDAAGSLLTVGRANVGSTNYINGIALAITDGKFRFSSYVDSSSVTSNILSTIIINDNQWHDIVVFLEDNVASIYIDGVFDVSGSFIEPTAYSNVSASNLVIGRLNVVGFDNYFSGQLDQIEIYDGIMSIIPDKYLVMHNNEYKYHDGTSWQVTTTTEENFIQFGMEQLSQITEAQWDELIGDISVVMWSDFEDKEYINVVLERDEFTPKDLLGEEYTVVVMNNEDIETQKLFVDAVGQSQEVYPLNDISLFGIREISSLTVTGSGNGKIAVSVDSGATWNTFIDNDWTSITEISQGMDFATFSSLTDSQLKALLGESKFIRFAYYLTGDTEFTNVLMKVRTEGIPEFANKDDYTMSYDLLTQTITYEINKDGHYIINYSDIK